MEAKTQAGLVAAALGVRDKAYAPFSQFYVGAAVLGDDGKVYSGVNVENSSYGLTICAERIAAGAAVTGGAKRLAGVAVATEGAHRPCGACRQFLYELAEETTPVLLVDSATGEVAHRLTLGDLLPGGFRLSS
ncbi:Cytidine deaminase [Pseudobythopirellula maris]|uniref:Cytidine deaminase n=1 Tax=Pseudobythopirellula maris TaxID=2527991 RepID=A0A5C5ZTN0_9BACT|nr:cytidine deaminase [Pseudobythopirellula maris]TWT90417.1 Cytidine deaminase [Pseudobythopirellula maris]